MTDSWDDDSCANDGVPFVCATGFTNDTAGEHTITMTFLGNANFNASTGSATYVRLPVQ